jgi:hypothetical protein
MHNVSKSPAAEARSYAQERLSYLGGLAGADVVERLERVNGALMGLASMLGGMPAVDNFDPTGIYFILQALAEDVERASHGVTLMSLGPIRR